MAPATNWLSFSLSPMEMIRSSDQSQFAPFDNSSAPTYLLDNLYSNGWFTNSKPPLFYPEGNNNQPRDAPSIGDSPIQTSFLEPENHSQSAPKLADFFGGKSTVRYSDEQTETQNSDLFRAFSVDDSGSINGTQLGEFNGHSTESSRDELGLSSCPTGALSLGVTQNQTQCSENQLSSNSVNKPFVPAGAGALSVADSDCTRRIVDTFGQRTSIYRGVTRHRWTGRYEAHLWDNSCRREGQARKGRQVYLGGYDKEEKAARAYDLAALKYWGHSANTNFPVSSYKKEIEEMKNSTKQEFIASLRRKSSGFSRGASMYRGVTRHHQQGRWQARIGRVAGNKDLYLGTFATEEEAAEAYDIAAIKFRGVNAVTNFEMSRYDVEAISTSALPIGGAAKRLKLSAEPSSNCISFEALQPVTTIPCGIPLEASMAAQLYHHGSLFHPDNVGPTSTSPAMSNQHQPGEFYLWPPHSYN